MTNKYFINSIIAMMTYILLIICKIENILCFKKNYWFIISIIDHDFILTKPYIK